MRAIILAKAFAHDLDRFDLGRDVDRRIDGEAALRHARRVFFFRS